MPHAHIITVHRAPMHLLHLTSIILHGRCVGHMSRLHTHACVDKPKQPTLCVVMARLGHRLLTSIVQRAGDLELVCRLFVEHLHNAVAIRFSSGKTVHLVPTHKCNFLGPARGSQTEPTHIVQSQNGSTTRRLKAISVVWSFTVAHHNHFLLMCKLHRVEDLEIVRHTCRRVSVRTYFWVQRCCPAHVLWQHNSMRDHHTSLCGNHTCHTKQTRKEL